MAAKQSTNNGDIQALLLKARRKRTARVAHFPQQPSTAHTRRVGDEWRMTIHSITFSLSPTASIILRIVCSVLLSVTCRGNVDGNKRSRRNIESEQNSSANTLPATFSTLSWLSRRPEPITNQPDNRPTNRPTDRPTDQPSNERYCRRNINAANSAETP